MGRWGPEALAAASLVAHRCHGGKRRILHALAAAVCPNFCDPSIRVCLELLPMTLVRRLIASRSCLPLRRLSASTLPSHSRGPTHPPLLNETIGQAFRRIVLRAPSAAAVSSVHQRLHWTYKQLSDAVDNAARALLSAGVKRGDRVGILSPNRWVA
jgi:non-ribosomal peptide synthetase component F